MTDRRTHWVWAGLTLLALAGLWEAGVRLFHVPPYLLPPPSRVVFVFFSQLPLLASHAGATLAEIALGLALGTCGGVLLAALIFASPPLERAIYPLIIASQMVPVFAIAPLLVVWFGYGLWPKVTVAALIVFFPIVVNTVDGLRSVNVETVDVMRSLGASRRWIFRSVRLPSSLPSLFSGLKVGATLAVVGATIGEWIGARQGLGYLMIQSNALLRIDRVFAAIAMLAVIGLSLFAGIAMLERYVLRWRTPRQGIKEEG